MRNPNTKSNTAPTPLRPILTLALVASVSLMLSGCENSADDRAAEQSAAAALLAVAGSDADLDSTSMAYGGYGGYGGSSGGSSSGSSSSSLWTFYAGYDLKKGTVVSDRGTCNGIWSLQGIVGCTKGNYNYNFKKGRCPGSGTKAVFFAGRVSYKGKEWDKAGTNQDHGGVCVTMHPTANVPIFHDGCTGYPGGNPGKMNQGPLNGWNPDNWGQVFHGACVIHDLCYKAEGAFSGKSKKDCDNEAKSRMYKICDRAYKNQWWLGVLNKRLLCKENVLEAAAGLALGSSAHYSAYNYSYDWRESAICAGSKSYDIVTGKCQ